MPPRSPWRLDGIVALLLNSFLHGFGIAVSALEPRLPLTTNLVMERSVASVCEEAQQWAPVRAGARVWGDGGLGEVAPGNVGRPGPFPKS